MINFVKKLLKKCQRNKFVILSYFKEFIQHEKDSIITNLNIEFDSHYFGFRKPFYLSYTKWFIVI